MRRLLIFAYDYPPALSGVRRTIKFIRYLRDYGWRCGVVTVKPVCAAGWDDAPLREVAPARPWVWRTGSLDPYRLCMKFRGLAWPLMRRVYHGPTSGGTGTALPETTGGFGPMLMRFLRRAVFIPDDRMGWLPFAVTAGLNAARGWKPHALYSTSYPHTAHVAAGMVHALTRIPWVADFRDGWTQNPAFFDPLTPLHAGSQRALERWVARHADRILTVSPPISAHLQQWRDATQSPVETLYNGFDDLNLMPPRDASPLNAPHRPYDHPSGEESGEEGHGGFRVVAEERTGAAGSPPTERKGAPAGEATPGNRFELLYGGTFFGTRRPDTLLRAFALLAERRRDFRQRAHLSLFTALEPRWLDLIRELGIDSMSEVHGFVPFQEIVAHQHRADALVLVVDTGPGSEIIVTQKVFEYLASGRPIWAIAGPGACRELLLRTGGAVLSPPDDPQEASRSLESLFDAWIEGRSLAADPACLAPFHRRTQTKRLAEILKDLVTGR